MKKLTVTEAQNELPQLVTETEPLVLTDGFKPVAILIHIKGTQSQPTSSEHHLRVLSLKDVLSDRRLRASIGDDSVCVVSSSGSEPAPVSETRGWWDALQQIEAGQKRRGFVGTVAKIDRGDQGYDERMEEIYKQTMPKKKPG